MRKSTIAAVIAATAATSACGHTRSEAPGPTVSRNYQVGNFDKIEVAGPYNVQVRTDSPASVATVTLCKAGRSHEPTRCQRDCTVSVRSSRPVAASQYCTT